MGFVLPGESAEFIRRTAPSGERPPGRCDRVICDRSQNDMVATILRDDCAGTPAVTHLCGNRNLSATRNCEAIHGHVIISWPMGHARAIVIDSLPTQWMPVGFRIMRVLADT